MSMIARLPHAGRLMLWGLWVLRPDLMPLNGPEQEPAALTGAGAGWMPALRLATPSRHPTTPCEPPAPDPLSSYTYPFNPSLRRQTPRAKAGPTPFLVGAFCFWGCVEPSGGILILPPDTRHWLIFQRGGVLMGWVGFWWGWGIWGYLKALLYSFPAINGVRIFSCVSGSCFRETKNAPNPMCFKSGR